MRSVAFYLDFVSPYTWLALTQAEAFAARHGIRWELRPVVYSALLDAHRLIGPVETPAKRRYTFLDVARSARRLGLRLVGPPAHPFRSIEALRTLTLFLDDARALRLAAALADACWAKGRSLTDPGVLAGVVSGAGIDAAGLEERIADEPIKAALHRSTEEAVAAGVFGVPTFALDGELFWGHDRMDQLAGRLAGEPAAFADAEPILARPGGATRRGKAGGSRA